LGGKEVRVFDSSAILLYLSEKTGRFVGSAGDRAELLSGLFFIGSGLGPFSGQAVHFQRAAPEQSAYAINRYRRTITWRGTNTSWEGSIPLSICRHGVGWTVFNSCYPDRVIR
jgi:hypothetical protein